MRARALEVLENSKDVRINRGIINICEWLDSLQLSLDGSHADAKSGEIRVAATYCASHNEWVALCVNMRVKPQPCDRFLFLIPRFIRQRTLCAEQLHDLIMQ